MYGFSYLHLPPIARARIRTHETMSRPLKRKTPSISHAAALQLVEKSAAEFNCTRDQMEDIAEEMRTKGSADISLVDPPALRRTLLARFPSCGEESHYVGQVACCKARIFAAKSEYDLHVSDVMQRRQEVAASAQEVAKEAKSSGGGGGGGASSYSELQAEIGRALAIEAAYQAQRQQRREAKKARVLEQNAMKKTPLARKRRVVDAQDKY